ASATPRPLLATISRKVSVPSTRENTKNSWGVNGRAATSTEPFASRWSRESSTPLHSSAAHAAAQGERELASCHYGDAAQQSRMFRWSNQHSRANGERLLYEPHAPTRQSRPSRVGLRVRRGLQTRGALE